MQHDALEEACIRDRGRFPDMNAPSLCNVSTARPLREEPIIRIPMLGLTVRVRLQATLDGSKLSVIETTNAAGYGPPLYRRAESEIFEIVTGRYLFEVDGHRFLARRGDLVSVPSGAARAFVNVTGTGGRQQVFVQAGVDVASFFLQLRRALDADVAAHVDRIAQLHRFGKRWGVEFLGPPLTCIDDSSLGLLPSPDFRNIDVPGRPETS
jgi:mannose-6-phosphate isomerase-like protein (cupin superfamily)